LSPAHYRADHRFRCEAGGVPRIGRAVPAAEGRGNVREPIDQGYWIIDLTRPERLFIVTIIQGDRYLAAREVKPRDAAEATGPAVRSLTCPMQDLTPIPAPAPCGCRGMPRRTTHGSLGCQP